MSDYPILCAAVTYPPTHWQPGETCENEVVEEGDFCPRHDEDDRSDEAYDDYLESLRKE